MEDDLDEEFQQAILESLGGVLCHDNEANELSESRRMLLTQQVNSAIADIIGHFRGSVIKASGHSIEESEQSVFADLERLLENLARNPGPGVRYRRLRLSNPRIGQLLKVPGVEAMLYVVGFEKTLDAEALEVPVHRTGEDVRAHAFAAIAQLRSRISESCGTRIPKVVLSASTPSSASDDMPQLAPGSEPVEVTTAVPSGRTAVAQEREASLRAALFSGDAIFIMEACDLAESCGSANANLIELVKESRHRARTVAEEALQAALAGGETLQLIKAVSAAELVGVLDLDLLRKAQHLLEKNGKEHNLASILARSASSASGTERHRVLAPLLSKVLAQKDGVPTPLLNFLPDQSRAFSLKPGYYGLRGGWPYHKPIGWLRYAVHREDFSSFKDWCVAYHGTKSESAARILVKGLQGPRRPDQLAHGQAGGTGSTIYLSPSVEYASHPVYSRMVELGPDHCAQLVMECRVAPGTFRQQARTLGPDHWPLELSFDQYLPPNACFEWLFENPKDVVVTGLLVREFGCGGRADPSLYGEAASRVSRAPDGVEREWTRLRAVELRRLLLAAPHVVVSAPHGKPVTQELLTARHAHQMAQKTGTLVAGQQFVAQAPQQVRRLVPQLISR